MQKLIFDNEGEHWYETGVSQGFICVHDDVPYPSIPMASLSNTTFMYADHKDGLHTSARQHGQIRYPWNGLISVNIQGDGAENNAVYADDMKYLNLTSQENCKFTIEAYSSPEVFDQCDGSANILNGLDFYEQPRKKFDFGFISKISNDYGAKKLVNDDEEEAPLEILHIFYNCTAAPSDRQYTTMNDSPEAMTLSWDVTAEKLVGEWYSKSQAKMIPFNTAHFFIDTRRLDPNTYSHYNQVKTFLFTNALPSDGSAAKQRYSWTHMPNQIRQRFTQYTMPAPQPNPGANW